MLLVTTAPPYETSPANVTKHLLHDRPRTPLKDRRNRPKDLSPLRTDFQKQPAKRHSNRDRPAEKFGPDAHVRPHLKDKMLRPDIKPPASKMSLFNLFSRPQVERQRGYHEPVPAASVSKPELFVNVVNAETLPPRAGTAISFRSTVTTKPLGRVKSSKEQGERSPGPASRRGSHWEPAPLFLAYPQSRKYGTLEVSGPPAGRAAVARTTRTLQILAAQSTPRSIEEERGSDESKRVSRGTSVRHVSNGSVAPGELPKKLFVLTTSGCLLQYADHGYSDRLPEKILHLGKDSAAFASDLISGRHYVLQISQAVDARGAAMASSGSLLSRLGIKNAAARRMPSSLLLVLPSAEDMYSWMVAIRAEIETLGGKKVSPDMAMRAKTGEVMHTPQTSQAESTPTHRYQIGRHPSRVSMLILPMEEEPVKLPSLPMAQIENLAADTAEDLEPALQNEPPMSYHHYGSGKHTDNISLISNTTPIVHKRQSNNVYDSTRYSRISSAPTATTSRDSSPNNSPPSDYSVLERSSEASRDSGVGGLPREKPSHRSLASYAPNRRRSVQALRTTGIIHQNSILPSTVLDRMAERASSVPPGGVASLRKRASTATGLSTIGFPAIGSAGTADAEAMSPGHAGGDRPQSFVGDLPPPSTWVNNRSPSKRSSHSPVRSVALPAQSAGSTGHSRISEPFKPGRDSSTPFNLPIKISSSNAASPEQPLLRDSKPFGQAALAAALTEEDEGEQKHDSIVAPVLSHPKAPFNSTFRTHSGRLSLFPTAQPTPPLHLHPQMYPIKGSPSSSIQGLADANVHSLKRPKSLQIRSDPTPFLSSIRSSSQSTGRSYTAPMRSLKPSRSARNVISLQALQEGAAPSYRASSLPPALAAEQADRATPLPSRPASATSGYTRARATSLKTRPSLPTLDLGMPVIGLGPPAPPPMAPLPQVPSWPASPA